MKLGCVVMASGFSRRFGQNKLLLPFRGRPLLWWTLRALPWEAFSRVTVVTRHPEVQALCRSLQVSCLLHTLPHLSDTIRLGIGTMEGMEGCLFAVADQPLCRRETLSRLIAAFSASPCRPARLCWEGRPGSPVLFPASLFPALAALKGEQGGGSVLPDFVTLVPVSHPDELEDADTPEAFARLEALSHLLPDFTSDMKGPGF